MSNKSKKNALQVQRDNQAGADKARAQGQHGGFSRSESSTGLTSSAQKREEDLLRKAGPKFDVLEAGGFAKRDQMRQAVNEDVQQLKRQKRVYNSAYRKAMRDGNPAQAIDILNSAKANKVNFGGIQAAGRDRDQVLQSKGEDLITAVARDGVSGSAGQQAPAGDTGLATPSASSPPVVDYKTTAESDPVTPTPSDNVPDGFLGSEGKGAPAQDGDGVNILDPGAVRGKKLGDDVAELTGSGSESTPVDDAKGGGDQTGRRLKGALGSFQNTFESLRPDSPTDRQSGAFFDKVPDKDPNSDWDQSKAAVDAFDGLFKNKPTEGLSGQDGGFRDPLPDSQTGKFKQKIERFQPFTSEAMSAQKSGRSSRSDGQSQSKQQAFFRNATKAQGKDLSEPGFGAVKEHVRKAVIRGEINPRYGAQYTADVAGVFKDYERLKRFGLLGSVSKPPSSKDMATNPEALFNWVSDVKEQAINKKK